jgi:hypothetical protein
LFAAAQHPEIWTWLAPIGSSREYFSAWFAASLAESEAGREGVFATIDRASGQADRQHALSEPARGAPRPGDRLDVARARDVATGANVEAKLLMLEHAFGALGCMRVELKTDARNERSRAAMAALPAQFEGIFRKHMLMPGIGVRDSAYYSVIDDDWPEVRANLERRLAAYLAN